METAKQDTASLEQDEDIVPGDTKIVQTPYSPPQETDASTGPVLSREDLDGDGDMDMVVRFPDSPKINWIENTIGKQADSVFTHTMFQDLIPTTVMAGDLNGDGTEDLVIGHMSGIKVFHNSDGWIQKDMFVSVSTPRAIILEDIDKDGYTDIVIRDAHGVLMVKNSPDGLGAQFMSWPELGDSTQLIAADIDTSTPQLEILTLDKDGMIGMISHDGSRWQALQQLSDFSATTICTCDFDKDGDTDIALVDASGNHLWLQNNGEGEVTLQDDEDLSMLNLRYPVEPESSPLPSDDTIVTESYSYSFRSIKSDVVMDDGRLDFQAAPDLSVETAMENIGPGGDMMFGTWWNNFLFGDTGNDYLDGGAGEDVLFGGEGEDTLIGGSGRDLLFGGSDNDLLAGQDGRDTLLGEGGDDTLFGGAGNDVLCGSDGDDILLGGTGNDTLLGGTGDDSLYGGTGADTLLGNEGSDTFVYTSADEGDDLVYRFTVGEDRFEFEFGSRNFHTIEGTYDGTLQSSGDAFVWEQTGDDTGILYYDADTGSSGNETIIAEVWLDSDDCLGMDDIDIV